MSKASDWNPAEHLDVAKRFEQMANMRETCPVAWSSRAGGIWDVLRYDDVVSVCGAPAKFSNAGQSRYQHPLPPLEYDPPAHRDFRRALAVFFTPKRISRLERVVRQNGRRLLAPLLEAGEGDLARGFSYPLPVLALCALLNIPASEWGNIKAWSENTLLQDSEDPVERALAQKCHESILAFAADLVRKRRAEPRDPAEDITTALLAARFDGEALEDEIIARALRLLISAGHNSTTSGLGNSLLWLARHPEEQDRLRAEPERVPAAIEEFLRFETPVQEMPRWANEPTELGGRQVQAGDRLGMFWSAANRDQAAFSQADECILDRSPNRHIAFGYGIHTCLGAPLARMEIRVALEEVLKATTQFEVNGDVSRPRFHRIGVTRLPVRLER